MRTYALGSKEIKFVILNQEENPFSMSNGVNFKDPNMNVSYPIFSIHGNHDDTVNNLSALDLLSSTGLVNYFGKWQSLLEVNLDPIILQVSYWLIMPLKLLMPIIIHRKIIQK